MVFDFGPIIANRCVLYKNEKSCVNKYCGLTSNLYSTIHGMTVGTFLIFLMTFVSWGVGSFVAKLAANRIGGKSVFWDLLAYFPAIFIYCMLAYKAKELWSVDKSGIALAMLAGLIGSFGAIGFYLMITKGETSNMVPLTALYPALTVLLGFLFLHETITTEKVVGILFSLIAIYLLSK
jgi:bacterial/archaeal transporter family protein